MVAKSGALLTNSKGESKFLKLNKPRKGVFKQYKKMDILKTKALDFLPSSIEKVLNCDDEIKKIVSVNYRKAILNAENSVTFYEFSSDAEAKRRTEFYRNYAQTLKSELQQIQP